MVGICFACRSCEDIAKGWCRVHRRETRMVDDRQRCEHHQGADGKQSDLLTEGK